MRIISSKNGMTQTPDGELTEQQLRGLFDESFLTFLKDVRQFVCSRVAEASATQDLQTTPHGQAGSRMVWSINEPLENSWRVAAYHSNEIAELTTFQPEAPRRADGIYVQGNSFSAPLAIKTADCLAVAVTLESGAEILAASCFHAGWRGYCGGIQRSAFEKIIKLAQLIQAQNKKNSEIHVSIGPAIFGSSYPCGQDVLEALKAHHKARLKTLSGWTEVHEKAFWSATLRDDHAQTSKIHPDLQQLICIELDALGVSLNRVTLYREDTFTSRRWPSHRRAMADGQNSIERLITHLCPPACPSVTNRASTV